MKAIQKVCFCLGFLILLAANANAGRWLTRDPIEFMERDPRPEVPGMSIPATPSVFDNQQINLYAYVLNNPISYVDPLGLQIDGALTPGIDEALMSPEQLQAARQAAQKAEQALQNKLHHVFDNPKHKLDACVKEFGGDKKKALDAIQDALKQQNLPNNQLFQTTVKVGNNTVTVIGKTVNGTPSVGTAFVP
jgi:RHS repeat-associated protein